MTTGIYCIRNTGNEKLYIGRSENIEKRFSQHRSCLKYGRHHCIHLQRAWKKYGKRSFVFEILTSCSVDKLIELEQYYIDNNVGKLYNVSNKATFGGDLITDHPNREQIIRQMTKSIHQIVDNMSQEERARRWGRLGAKNGMYGKTHSTKARQKISEANIGGSGARGRKISDETKRKISEKAKLRTGDKNPFYGKTHSAETRQKISAARMGSKPPNMRKVVADDVIYESVRATARALRVTPSLIIYRIRSPKYNYAYFAD